MATRQLRKLRKQQELLNLQDEAARKEEESDDEPVLAKPRANLFAGFAALGDDGDDDNNSEADEDEEAGQAQQEASASKGDAPAPAKKSKKPKKKKKKGKKTGSAAHDAPTPEEHDSLDEIDRAIEQLNLASSKVTATSSGTSEEKDRLARTCELLSIDFQHLKPGNEMRRMFGKVMETAAAEENTQRPQRLRAGQQQVDLETFLRGAPEHPSKQGQRSMFDAVIRNNPFVEGKKTWPKDSAHGLKMTRLTKGDEPIVEFTFAHDRTYEELEGQFFALVQMHDPMLLIHFLFRHPYHISSLIQVSKIAKQDQNSALAQDLCERALFTLGRVSLSEFRKKLEQGRARLDFARPENRQLYLAGYNLIKNLIMKGTYKTALEWTKLLLSLDFENDPYGMKNWVHVLAIRAHEARWFHDLCETTGLMHNREDSSDASNTAPYAFHTLTLAKLQLKDRDGARACLVDHMERTPWLYAALFSALGLDTPTSIWGAQPRDPEEEFHTQLYIHMTKDLWNNPEAIALLMEAGNIAIKNAPTQSPGAKEASLADARFVYLDNTPALMALVPRKMLQAAPNFDFDPLPPPREKNIFSTRPQKMPWAVTTGDQFRARMRARDPVRDEAMELLVEALQEDDRLEAMELLERAREHMPHNEELHAELEGFVRAQERTQRAAGGGVGAWPDDHADDDEGGARGRGVQVEDEEQDGNEVALQEGNGREGFMGRLLDTLLPHIFNLNSPRNPLLEQLGDEEDEFAEMPGAWGSDEEEAAEWHDAETDDMHGADDFEGEDDFGDRGQHH
ncbi:transcriptional repressor TCF25-domain-containing protein [Diplogelasinospora grovesii]|uniref:Transcriptional repressor TCF25-domain-containing protein n=1 Tax=Diplogelasinospora grovesii TaxID=303347 RepID=A0AAN6N9P0_9PEZI|nr:transcriptional repressor TCF25-domain-containing protein [Diplogelasinospora grovesii]